MTQIHCNIKDFATQTAHKLGLGMGWSLEVHAANGSTARCQGVVYLGNVLARDECLQFLATEKTLQISPAVTNRFALEHSQAGKRGIQYV
jgi:hypothetical protein